MIHRRNGVRKELSEAKEGPLELRRVKSKGNAPVGRVQVCSLVGEPSWVLSGGYLSGGLMEGPTIIFISFPGVSFWIGLY